MGPGLLPSPAEHAAPRDGLLLRDVGRRGRSKRQRLRPSRSRRDGSGRRTTAVQSPCGRVVMRGAIAAAALLCLLPRDACADGRINLRIDFNRTNVEGVYDDVGFAWQGFEVELEK